jgi:hypothetical protein
VSMTCSLPPLGKRRGARLSTIALTGTLTKLDCGVIKNFVSRALQQLGRADMSSLYVTFSITSARPISRLARAASYGYYGGGAYTTKCLASRGKFIVTWTFAAVTAPEMIEMTKAKA